MRFDGPFVRPGTGSALDLWFIDLSVDPGEDESAILSADELDRVHRLIIASKRRQMIRARAALRRVLALVVGEPDPAALRFEYGEHGKPTLDRPGAPTFNLSHSHHVGMLGVVAGPMLLGIDVEHARAGRAFDSIAEHFFADAEAGWLRALPPEQTAAGFYRMWTHKEAYLKALGTGLSFSSRGFTVTLADEPQTPARCTASTWPGDQPAIWRFTTLPSPTGYAASACWIGDPLTLRCFVAPGSDEAGLARLGSDVE